MKKQFEFKKVWCHLIILLALFTSCQSDDDDSRTGNNAQLSFTLPNSSSFAMNTAGAGNSMAGTGSENGGANDKIAFYQFDQNGNYERKYVLNYADATATTNDTRTYSIDISEAGEGEKRFVIIESADANDFPNMIKTNTVGDLANTQTVAEYAVLTAPFVMSNAKDNDKLYVTVSDIQNTKTPISVKLKRRVARFDLVNDSDVSGLIIDKVYVKNRRTRGFIGDIEGNAGEVSTDVLEIPAESLTNGGTSFYLYPTELTGTLNQDEKTVVWATTRFVDTNATGPKLHLDITTDINVEANRLYQLNVKKVDGSMGFDITVVDWTDGNSLDWITVDDGIYLPDNKAVLTEGTDVKGTHVKITAETPLPYTIKRVKTSSKATADAAWDGGLPSWLSISSTTTMAGSSIYRHEFTYTVTERPSKTDLFAITYLTGSTSDDDLLVIGFVDPYPGTPLPCLSWGNRFFSPTHAKQSTYLAHNTKDKAYFCGNQGYTFDIDMSGKSNDVSVNPCPAGWSPLNDNEAKDYLSWIGDNLKKQIAESVYSYSWYDGEDASKATDVRILGGYPKSQTPNYKDIAVFGTWPNAAWIEVNLPGLTVGATTYGNEWPISGDYGVPYRCIRDKEGWK